MRAVLRKLLVAVLPLSLSALSSAQINTDRMMSVGRTALYYDDYVLSIQYFNQVISAKPYLYEPYFYRAVAKLSLEDYRGAEQDCNSSLSRNPYVVNSYQVRGLSRIYQNRYEEAEKDFRKGLSLDPENRALRHNLILSLARREEYDQAIIAADTLLSISPKYTPAMAMKSSFLAEKNDTAGALEWINKAIEIDRYDAGLLQDRGLLLARMERYSEAEADMDKAIYLDPANASIYINRAMVRYCLDNLNGALSDYDMALRIDPGNIIGHYNRGNLRAQIGDDNRAIEDFDMVIDAEPDNMMAIFYRGLLRHTTGDMRGAESDLTRVLEEFPQFIYGYQLRAEVRSALGNRRGAEEDALVVLREQSRRFNDMNNPDHDTTGSDDSEDEGKTRNSSDKNVYNYRKIVVADELENSTGFTSEYRGKVQNRNVDVQYLSSYRLSYFRVQDEIKHKENWTPLMEELMSDGLFMKRVYMESRDVTLDQNSINSLFDDIDRLTAMLAQEPSDAKVLLARALDFCLLQDYESAMDDLDEAVKTGNGMWAVWFLRAQVRVREIEMHKADKEISANSSSPDEKGFLMIDPGYQAVLSDLTKVLDIAPDFQYALYNRGTYYAMTNDLHAAIVDLDRAIEIDETLAEAWYNRGIVHVFLGRMDEAFRDLGKAGELGIYSAYNIIKRFSKAD